MPELGDFMDPDVGVEPYLGDGLIRQYEDVRGAKRKRGGIGQEMSVLEAMDSPRLFQDWFDSSTWKPWRSFLATLFGLELEDSESLATYQRCTERIEPATEAFDEAWLIVGRRGGKSLISALVAVFLACFRDYSEYLKPGEVGTVAVIAADRKQTRTIMRYIEEFLDVPALRDLVVNPLTERIELAGRIVIEVHTGSFRTVRGYTLIAVICDEIAFWRSEHSANPDREIIAAVRPGLATIPTSMLLCLSSPYARRGVLWEAYDKHYAKPSRILVWKAPTLVMNPSFPQSVVDRAVEEDKAAARAEYGAEFRTDIEAFVSRETLDACIVTGVTERPPRRGGYVAFVDPSGGSIDSMVLAIARQERRTEEDGTSVQKAVLCFLHEVEAPFDPSDAVKRLKQDLRRYGVTSIVGDAYAGQWPRSRFAATDAKAKEKRVRYEVSDLNRSELYLELLPMMNAGEVELLDNATLKSQLNALERRTSRAGRDSVDHPPGGHDDVANAAAGALLVAAGRVANQKVSIW